MCSNYSKYKINAQKFGCKPAVNLTLCVLLALFSAFDNDTCLFSEPFGLLGESRKQIRKDGTIGY